MIELTRMKNATSLTSRATERCDVEFGLLILFTHPKYFVNSSCLILIWRSSLTTQESGTEKRGQGRVGRRRPKTTLWKGTLLHTEARLGKAEHGVDGQTAVENTKCRGPNRQRRGLIDHAWCSVGAQCILTPHCSEGDD